MRDCEREPLLLCRHGHPCTPYLLLCQPTGTTYTTRPSPADLQDYRLFVLWSIAPGSELPCSPSQSLALSLCQNQDFTTGSFPATQRFVRVGREDFSLPEPMIPLCFHSHIVRITSLDRFGDHRYPLTNWTGKDLHPRHRRKDHANLTPTAPSMQLVPQDHHPPSGLKKMESYATPHDRQTMTPPCKCSRGFPQSSQGHTDREKCRTVDSFITTPSLHHRRSRSNTYSLDTVTTHRSTAEESPNTHHTPTDQQPA